MGRILLHYEDARSYMDGIAFQPQSKNCLPRVLSHCLRRCLALLPSSHQSRTPSTQSADTSTPWFRIAPSKPAPTLCLQCLSSIAGTALHAYSAIYLSLLEHFAAGSSIVLSLDPLHSSMIRRVQSSSWFPTPSLYSCRFPSRTRERATSSHIYGEKGVSTYSVA